MRHPELQFIKAKELLYQYTFTFPQVLLPHLVMNLTTDAERETLGINGFCLQSDSLSKEEWSAPLSQGSSSWVSISRTVATISVVLEQGGQDLHYPMATFPPCHKTWLWSILDIHRDLVEKLKIDADD